MTVGVGYQGQQQEVRIVKAFYLAGLEDRFINSPSQEQTRATCDLDLVRLVCGDCVG